MTASTKSFPVLLGTLALSAATLSACGSGDSGDSGDSGAGDAGASSSASSSGKTCDYISSGQQPARKVEKPPATPTETGNVAVTIATNRGDMTATLDGQKAPCAVNSFLSLAKQGWYDDTNCHRVTSDSRGFHVLQCGDPTGSGTGDPGYRFAEEVDGSEDYTPGTIAMAKTQEPDTTGAQLFIVYDKTSLPPQYTELGRLDAAGLQVAKKAAAAATQGKADGYDGPPAQPVTITKVTED